MGKDIIERIAEAPAAALDATITKSEHAAKAIPKNGKGFCMYAHCFCLRLTRSTLALTLGRWQKVYNFCTEV
jgi:hypothetical protein